MSTTVTSRPQRTIEKRAISDKKRNTIVTHGNYHIDLSSAINEGKNAKIVRGINLINRQQIAAKIYLSTRASVKEGAAELAVLNKMSNSGVVPEYYGAFEENGRLFILMELGQCDLWSIISKLKKPLGEDLSKNLFRKLVQSVHKLHSQGIYHGDIKLENIIYDDRKAKVTLIDFGTSLVKGLNYEGNFCPKKQMMAIQQLVERENNPEKHQEMPFSDVHKPYICGKTLGYIAPENLLLGPDFCDPASADVYSLGVVLYTFIFQRLPVADMEPNYYSSRNLLSLNARRKDLSVSPASTSSLLRDLIYGMLHPNPQLRLNLDQVLRHPWTNLSYEI